MSSLKASQQGLVQIKRALAAKGWKISSERWLVAASKVLEPQGNWHESGPYAYGCSSQTWERFLQRTPIRDRSFIAFCQILGLHPEDVVESTSRFREDWNEAPDIPNFHGRVQELDTLEQWILEDRIQLVSIVGLAGIGKTRLVRGGIGKTDLSLQLARRIRGEFDCLIWRRLINAPPLTALLTDLIEFISEQQATKLADTPDGLIMQLLHYLRQRRCLLVLDNAESILQGGMVNIPLGDVSPRAYQAGYEGYEAFFRRIGEAEHQSCLLLTSRINPQDIEAMEGVWPVRSLELGGIDTAAGQAIFQDISHVYNATFQGSAVDWEALISFYSGNPLALEVAARHILRRFDGDLSQFLKQDLRIFGKIRDLLNWHFERFSDTEKDLMFWLAINREAVSISELREDVLLPLAKKQVPETLDSLERYVPIEKSYGDFTLQPVLIEYMSDRFVSCICQELQSGNLQLFNSHALVKAAARDYIRESQVRIILRSVIEQTTPLLGLDNQSDLQNQFYQLITHLRQLYQGRPGYAAGNLLNMMRYGGINISHCDFSQLAIWQADLQSIPLRYVNFAGCWFNRANFTHDFGGVHAIAVSPSQNMLAMGDSIGGIRLLHLKDWQTHLYLQGHVKDMFVTAVAFSPDGTLLASSCLDRTVKLWDIRNGECLKTFVSGQKFLWSVAFGPDGKTVASGGDDNAIQLWDIHTGECRTLEGHRAWVWSLKFHPSKNLLVSGAYDKTVRLWDTDTGKCCRVLNGHDNIVLSVAFHPNGERLLSGSADNTIKVWDIHTGECLDTLIGHTKEVYSTAFSSDGRLIASGSFDKTAKVWDAQTGQPLKTLKGHIRGVRTLAFGPKDNILATGEAYPMLKLWNAETGRCLKTWRGYTNLIWALSLSPDGQRLASGSLDGIIRLWHVQTGELVTTLKGHGAWIWSVVFSPDGRTLLSSSDDETLRLWDLETRQCRHILRGHTKGGVWAAALSPDGQCVASGGRDGTVRFWDAATGKHLRCLAAHSESNWIWAVTFSPDGKMLASCSDDQTIKLWDVETGVCRLTITDLTSKVRTLAFHPDGQRLVSGGEDQQVKLWDPSTGDLVQTLRGHDESILTLIFSPDGKMLISAGIDATIRLWDFQTGRCLQVLRGHSSSIRGLALTPDRHVLASSSTDNTIRLWNIETGQTQKLLRPERPYEGMNIADIRGLTAAQKDALIALGAVEHS